MARFQGTAPKEFPVRQELIRRARELLRNQDFGTLVRYDDIGRVLGIVGQSPRAQNAMRAAGKLVLVEQKKLLVNVPMRGYAIAHPHDHAGHAGRYRARSRRDLMRALAALIHVASDVLTPDELARHIREQTVVGLSLAFQRKVVRVKTLPSPAQSGLPSSRVFTRLITRRAPEAAG